VPDELDPGLGPDLSIVARQVVDAKRRLKKTTPSAVDLADALTELAIEDTIKGSSTLTLTVADPDYELRDSGFFDADRDGKLDRIDVNYPHESRFWWRLTQVGPSANTVEMVFMERAAVHLMGHFGPVKASRAKKTRAEFLKSLCDKVKGGGGITFHSRELHKSQPIEGTKVKKDEQRKADKGPGINPDAKILIKGVEADRKQKRRIEISLDEATGLNAPELAVKAMLCAGIGESDFTNVVNSLGYGGVYQGQVAKPGGENWFAPMSDDERTKSEAHYFLVGGRGYNGGGAIALANAHSDWSPGKIATTVEGSGQPGSFYERDARGHNYIHEAQAMIDAYGGVSFGGTVYRKQFNFEVGSADEPHESFWDACNRLAEDVRWPFFLDGNDAYFDSEMTLVRQKPALVIRRGDPAVLRDPEGTWDARHIATEVTLDLACAPLEFRAGEVVQLEDYGPFSTGSTAKLPGRWLIETIERKRSELFSTFTLKQPEKPKLEPAAEQAERSDPADSGGDVSGTPKDVIDNVVLPIAADCGIRITPLQVSQANARHSHSTADGNVSDHAGPPEHAWAADMSNSSGGNFDRSAPTPEMDKLAKALQRKFDMPDWKGLTNREATFGGKRYRFQLIYRTDAGGGHWNHVHFGVKRISKYGDNPTPSGSTPTSGPTPLP
jgi:hypothetical protein